MSGSDNSSISFSGNGTEEVTFFGKTKTPTSVSCVDKNCSFYFCHFSFNQDQVIKVKVKGKNYSLKECEELMISWFCSADKTRELFLRLGSRKFFRATPTKGSDVHFESMKNYNWRKFNNKLREKVLLLTNHLLHKRTNVISDKLSGIIECFRVDEKDNSLLFLDHQKKPALFLNGTAGLVELKKVIGFGKITLMWKVRTTQKKAVKIEMYFKNDDRYYFLEKKGYNSVFRIRNFRRLPQKKKNFLREKVGPSSSSEHSIFCEEVRNHLMTEIKGSISSKDISYFETLLRFARQFDEVYSN